MDKTIHKYNDIKDKIIRGVDAIADPVRQTLSPRGGNALIEDDKLNHILTNDGVTIARNITIKDPIENSIVSIIKEAALKTNAEAGDGTTTTILLSQVLIKEGLKMVDEGYSWIDIREIFKGVGDNIKKRIIQNKIDIKNDKDLENIAKISANSDEKIAKDVVEVIKIAGEDGMVFLEPNVKANTELVKDLGFMINSGIPYPELLNEPGKFTITYKDVPILITDKRIYYPEEAETILTTALQSGYKNVVIVAADFMGDAVNTFITNHTKGIINVLLIKDPKCTERDNTSLQDLASYLDGKVVSDKTGSLVNKITKKDFVMANQVYADPTKTLITPQKSASKELKERIKYIKEESKKNPDDKVLKGRLSSLTNGVVTIKVGGNTRIEIREKIYRYEDAVNATRAAMRGGYLVGGGIGLLGAFNPKDYTTETIPIARKYCEAVVRQIAENCGKHPDTVLENIRTLKRGYNALTNKYEDLLKAGVIDPYLVIKLAIDNSVTVANIIISIKNYIINNLEDYDKEKDINTSEDTRTGKGRKRG